MLTIADLDINKIKNKGALGIVNIEEKESLSFLKKVIKKNL